MAIKAKKFQPAKTAAIEAAKTTLGGFENFVFVEYRGLTVAQITELRDKLREKNAELHVIKNNFAKIAFEELKVDSKVADYLSGPTAITMIKDEANEAAKVLYDFAKDVPALAIKGAWVDKSVFAAEEIEAFSKLPGKKQLIAMLMSAINGPVQKLAATLQAYVDKKSAEGGAAE
jgi:large subunit ribosomal protein L10